MFRSYADLPLKQRQRVFAWLMLTPALVMVFVFIAYPMIYSFLLTFSEFSISETHWFASGFSNYQKLFQDRAFLRAIEFTIGYTVFYVPISVALALVIGVLLHQVKIGATFFRSMLFLPSVIPLSLGFLMFQWVLDPNNGIFNYILGNLLGQTDFFVAWLNDRSTVLGTMIAITLWGFGPWILMLAGLLAIPQTLYEAARVDGVNSFQEFFYITLPQMRTTIMIVTVLQVIRSLKIFTPIYILTSGGPAGATRSLYYLVWERIQRGPNWYTYAATVGWVFTFMVIIISVTIAVLLRKREEDF